MSELAAGVTKGVAQSIGGLAKDAAIYLTQKGRREGDKLAVTFEFSFKKFLDRNYKRHSKIKTLLNTNMPVQLEATYESPTIRFKKISLNEDQLIGLIEEEKFIVITGLGGSGKSMLLKHLFVRFYNEARGRIPFLVEMRNIPAGMSLFDYMHGEMKAISPKFDLELFEFALRSGKFLFLLDAFDEIDEAHRALISKQISDLTYAYGENRVVVTSRPDNVFGAWNEFHVGEMEGFSKKQVLSLVGKLKYDRSVKKNFTKLVRDEGLYESHTPYLANPLLCTIMLLTFDQGAEIPSKMHLFFGQTFDVLFYKHDATKGTAFRRKFLTSLSIDDFRSVLSAFSAFSYIDHGPTLDRREGVHCAEVALQYCRFTEKPDSFLSDLCSSTSIMVREGDTYSYIHRTFQEYFVANFLATQEVDGWGDLIEKLIIDKPNDSVVHLLRDMNGDKFDREFLLPRLSALCGKLKAIDIEKKPSLAFKLFYIDVSTGDGESQKRISSWTVGKNDIRPKFHYIVMFLREGEFLRALNEDFDWEEQFRKFGGTEDEYRSSVHLTEITDEAFIDTPMVRYLSDLRDAAFREADRIKKDTRVQRSLVADAFFKRPRKGK